MADHWHRWRVVYCCALVGLALWLADRWAGAQNAARDAGITWIDARSPRTLQTYIVRAKVENGRLLHFTLESGDRYSFDRCQLPARNDTTHCADTGGRDWIIEP